jgi:hypothetical protein
MALSAQLRNSLICGFARGEAAVWVNMVSVQIVEQNRWHLFGSVVPSSVSSVAHWLQVWVQMAVVFWRPTAALTLSDFDPLLAAIVGQQLLD